MTANTAIAKDVIAEEILAGLQSEAKTISPKYFYDQRGSALFDEITTLDEYYVTRTEQAIINDCRDEICTTVGGGANIIEPGAGSCEKIRWLLPDLAPRSYVPMDISAEHLRACAAKLREEFPDLRVRPQVGDHTNSLRLADDLPAAPAVFFYPGSSIGNYTPSAAADFMARMRAQMGSDGGLLIGVDSKKPASVLNAAYNDRRGVTARFNINMLEHINRLLDGTLIADYFEHLAFYNEERGRIEMHLRCTHDHTATLAGETVEFAAGETIHTESSYKYYPEEFAELAAESGLALQALWQDDRRWFSLLYLTPA
jgi:L-histidine N-alpha-methyltransferase